jgi:multisubunit Na+/H+ antiporter MnhG subunit
MSAALEKARQQVANGDYNRALDSLNVVRGQASGNLDELRGLLEVATSLQAHGGSRVKRHCAQIIAEAQAALRLVGEDDIGTTPTLEAPNPPPSPSPQVTAAASQPAPPAPQRPQYQSLRLLRGVYLILGWIVMVGGTIGVIYLATHTSYNQFGEQTNHVSGGGVALLLVGVALYSLMLFAGASLITLFLRVEANSRETIELLRAGRGNG